MFTRSNAILAVLAVLGTSVADSAVIYTMSGGSSPIPAYVEYISPDFITQDRLVPADQLAACSIQPSLECLNVEFSPNVASPGLPILVDVMDITLSDASGAMSEFITSFSAGAFSSPGVYQSVLGQNRTTLTVSEVPEPTPFTAFCITGIVLTICLCRIKRASSA
jgi:hypothetical protein